MAISPLAVACVVVGAATTVRRIELSASVLDFETASITPAHHGLFLDGAAPGSPTRPRAGEPVPPRSIDVGGAAVMTAALAVARQAMRQARTGAR